MGSFLVTCAISGLTIREGDGCYVVPIIRNENNIDKNGKLKPEEFGDFDTNYLMFGFPIKGKYADSGELDDIDRNNNTAILEKEFRMDIKDFISCLNGRKGDNSVYDTYYNTLANKSIITSTSVEGLIRKIFTKCDEDYVCKVYIEDIPETHDPKLSWIKYYSDDKTSYLHDYHILLATDRSSAILCKNESDHCNYVIWRKGDYDPIEHILNRLADFFGDRVEYVINKTHGIVNRLNRMRCIYIHAEFLDTIIKGECFNKNIPNRNFISNIKERIQQIRDTYKKHKNDKNKNGYDMMVVHYSLERILDTFEPCIFDRDFLKMYNFKSIDIDETLDLLIPVKAIVRLHYLMGRPLTPSAFAPQCGLPDVLSVVLGVITKINTKDMKEYREGYEE